MTTDPLNDPAPRWATKSVVTAVGYAVGIAVTVAGLTWADNMNSAADGARDVAQSRALEAHKAQQALIDQAQAERLNKIEARQIVQDQMLFDICAAVQCRGRAKRVDDGQ